MRSVAWVWAAVCLWAAVALGAPPDEPADPLEGALVSLRITGGLMPYRRVSYEVLWRKRMAVASHYRALVNYDEALSNMKLVPTEDFVALLDRLGREGAFDLPDAPPPGRSVGAQTFELEVRRNGKTHLFRVTEPTGQPDARYAATVDLVRAFVIDVVGEIPFRNVFFDAGAFGFLNLTAVPVCRLWVDGRDTGLDTPIYGLELPKGSHKLELVAKDEGWKRDHTIRTEGGMTTILHMDLR